MKKFYYKAALCAIVFLLYANMVYTGIKDGRSLYTYMILGMGVVTLCIGMRIYLKNEYMSCSNPNAKVFNLSSLTPYYVVYFIALSILLIIEAICVRYYQWEYAYLLPTCIAFLCLYIMNDFDMLLVRNDCLYIHGKWYAYEDMKQCVIKVHAKESVVSVTLESLKTHRFIVKKEDSDLFINTLKKYIELEVVEE